MNSVTRPAVSLSTACFGHGVYEEEAARKCISNLIAVGYRRIYVDLYWSADRKHWGFCPVAIPANANGVTPLPTSNLMSSAPPATISTGKLPGLLPSDASSAEVPSTSETGDDPDALEVDNGKLETPSLTPRPTETSPSTPVAHQGIPTSKSPSGAVLYKIGPYSCTQSVDIRTMINVLSDYFEKTEDTLRAHMLHVVFNVHAAASASYPEKPPNAPSAGTLPSPQGLIGNMLDRSFGSYIYRPSQLVEDRKNLNESWYDVSSQKKPIAEYFTTNVDQNNRHRTPDGWPCDGYTVLTRAKRLIVGWGTVDPQMAAYNFKGDRNIMFSRGSIESRVDVGVEGSEVKSGCFYDSGETTESINKDAAWATAEIPAGNSSQLSSISRQISSCGISPIVNRTLQNVTADQNIEPYRNISLSSIWSWAPDEPQNSTGSYNDQVKNTYRCAVMDTSLLGQWRARDCFDKFHAACRKGNSPYEWSISEKQDSYEKAGSSCPDDSSFSVPRTALENTYLYEHLLTERKDAINASSSQESERVVWVDLNSFDVPTCWVTHGHTAQCPYETDDSAIERRAVIIPTVAAIIFLILTALTLFVKCNVNRRNSRRRRVIGGWEYEGVPS